MKRAAIILGLTLLFSGIGFTGYFYNSSQENGSRLSKFSMLSDEDKASLIESINSDWSWNGIDLKGKVEFVTSFPDIKIEYVTSFPDIKVKMVSSFPDDCGEWQEVTSFPDFKVQIVTSFPDIKVQEVSSFPGL